MSGSHLTHLDAYCERAGDPTFWAEPLNAVTNLSFIFFAILAIRILKPLSFKSHADIWGLVISMIAIGVGSALWHTYAVTWAVLADTIPIYIFINIYIFSLFIRIFKLRWWKAGLIWLAYQSVGAWFSMNLSHDTLNGTIMYAPTYGLLVIALIWLSKRGHEATSLMRKIVVVFTISLVFRTLDLELCDIIPVGTHFMWHILNGWVLYSLIKLMISGDALRPNKNTNPSQP